MRAYSTFQAFPNGLILWQSTHDSQMNAAFKQAVPPGARRPHIVHDRFHGWLFDPRYADEVATLSNIFLNIAPRMPSSLQPPELAARVIRLEYLGGCKAQYDGNSAAAGAIGPKQWDYLFPEMVLRKWFHIRTTSGPPAPEFETVEAPVAPIVKLTLYETLGIAENAGEDVIKKAYRRAALHLHPDRNKEADAKEQFLAVGDAYKILSDPLGRRRYDMALRLERQVLAEQPASQRPAPTPAPSAPFSPFSAVVGYGYRAPYRCGHLVVKGYQYIKFIVTEIVAWEDITDSQGRTMVSSWPIDPFTGNPGPDYVIEWV